MEVWFLLHVDNTDNHYHYTLIFNLVFLRFNNPDNYAIYYGILEDHCCHIQI